MSIAEQKIQVLVLIRDLIFETKIRSTAQALGVVTACVRSCDELAGKLEKMDRPLVLVDLNLPDEEGLRAVAICKGHPSDPRTIAFVSHVDQELAAKASTAGADSVLPRSAFARDLPEILGQVRRA